MRCFENQIAVVTGASSGIGKAIALGLAGQGANLCLVGRKLEKLKEIAKIAQSITSYIKIYRVDMVMDRDIEDFISHLKQDVRQVNILVHSAGVISHGRLYDAPVKDFDSQYRVNVRAPYILTQALLPVLKSCKGQIVFMNSSAGLQARANVGQYAATKNALKALADSLREEVNADEMRILSVFLGRTASPMQEAVHKMEGRAYHPERLIQPEDVAAVIINALSLPRTAEVTEIYIRPLMKP